jgi:ADP-heptose:LPS heptosyltransferase
LNWVNYDFNWYKYFKSFPKTEINPENTNGDYIVLHLVSTTSKEHLLPKWYISSLVKQIKNLGKKIFIVSTPEINQFYSEFESDSQITILNKDIKEICNIICNAKLFIGTDSGFRFVAYGCGVPTITFSKQANAPHQVLPSHYIRWLIYPELTFPLAFDCKYIYNLSEKLLKNKGYMVLPYLQDFDSQAIKRNYTVNLEKSVLN